MRNIIIYSTENCHVCKEVKKKMEEKNIIYEERTDKTHLEEMKELKIRQLPVVITENGEKLIGFKALSWVRSHE